MSHASAHLPVPGTDRFLTIERHGHWGRGVLVFPCEAGSARDAVERGIVDAVRPLVDSGAVSLFCVDSLDGWTWSDNSAPTEERAQRHGAYHAWLVEQAIPWVYDQLGGHQDLVTTGVSMGAYHAVQLTLQRADLAPTALALSGSYDPRTWNAWGDFGDATYHTTPPAYVANLWGDHLEWLRSRVDLHLVVGQGPFEVSPTRSLPSTLELADIARSKGLRAQAHVWGHDSAHDWPWWQRQLGHYLPQLV